MSSSFRRFRCLMFLLPVLATATTANGQTANTASSELPRFLVYFDEFSANLSDEAKSVIADAAKRAKETSAKGVVVQARASATGTAEANKSRDKTRSPTVTDQLEAEGIPGSMTRQNPIGQTGSSDPTVYNRRVDIILQR